MVKHLLVSLAFEVMIDRIWYYYRCADLPATWEEVVATCAALVWATLGRTSR